MLKLVLSFVVAVLVALLLLLQLDYDAYKPLHRCLALKNKQKKGNQIKLTGPITRTSRYLEVTFASLQTISM